MLVCPQCQFENPDTHRFCQKCGGSLTEQECPICSTAVAFDAEYCLHCGTATGIFWKALLIPVQQNNALQNGFLPQGRQERMTVPNGCVSTAAANTTICVLSRKYLDTQQRYLILAPLPDVDAIEGMGAEVRVLDCQPLQSSPLRVVEHWHPNQSTQEISPALTVPAIAQPYLELQERYPALPLPQVHDAWEQEDLQIVLLKDRSYLPTLLESWRDEQVLPIQLLHWLHEMIEFWAVLQSENCCQSLLVLDNLRVDEDSLLCLQRLYADRPEQSPQLRDLGKLWQTLFQQSQRTQRGDLAQLYSDLEFGVVYSLEQLRSRIEEIAATLQPKFSLTTLPSNLSEPLNPLNPFMIDDAILDDTELFSGNPPNAGSNAAGSNAAGSNAAGSNAAGSNTIEPQDTPTPAIATPLNELEVSGAVNFPESDNFLEPPDSANDQKEHPSTVPAEETAEADDSPTVVLPMRLASLEEAGLTDIGRQRDHNEDCFSIQTEVKKVESFKGRSLQAKGLYILCDGMGGHAGGEVASALAVETLQKYFAEHWQEKLPSHESIRQAIHEANQAIYDLNQQNSRSGSGRMGTTLVLLLLQDTEAAIAHVGDSRLYRFSRRRGLETVTVDHEVGQREIQRGVEPTIAYARPDAYQLTQALGPRDETFVSPDIRFLEINEDMLLLLCSDGLTDNNLLEIYWQSHVEPLLSSKNNLEQGVHQLIELANQHNGHDNITAIAIRAKVRPNLDQFGP